MKKSLIVRMVIALTLTLSVAVTNLAQGTIGIASPYATKTFTQKFYEDEQVEVGVIGDGSTDLDLYVYGPTGNLIAKRESSRDVEEMTLDIFRTGTFTIKVVNRGAYSNKFVVYTEFH